VLRANACLEGELVHSGTPESDLHLAATGPAKLGLFADGECKTELETADGVAKLQSPRFFVYGGLPGDYQLVAIAGGKPIATTSAQLTGLILEPSAIEFGAVEVGKTATRTLAITNFSGEEVQLKLQIETETAENAGFTMSDVQGPLNYLTLAPRARATVPVAFFASSVRRFPSWLHLVSKDADYRDGIPGAKVRLTGEGTGPPPPVQNNCSWILGGTGRLDGAFESSVCVTGYIAKRFDSCRFRAPSPCSERILTT